jgi:23S rRNA (uridine2552-2'-O)-methyltransferase
MPRDWRKQQNQDKYFKQAKADGYRARSAYKLIEMNEKYRLIRPDATILDLGAAPGSWSQVAAGLGAKIVAVDLSPIQPLAGVTTIRGDITKPETIAQVESALAGHADLVMSDVSPATTGIQLVDHARSIELARASLQLAIRFLRANGKFIVKVFEGEDFQTFVKEARQYFRQVNVHRPPASRQESSEHYVVGVGFRGKENSKATEHTGNTENSKTSL